MKNKYIKLGIFAFFGAVAGYAYYYYIGCYNGHCLISSNPYISTGYGMAAAILLGWETRKPKEKKAEE